MNYIYLTSKLLVEHVRLSTQVTWGVGGWGGGGVGWGGWGVGGWGVGVGGGGGGGGGGGLVQKHL